MATPHTVLTARKSRRTTSKRERAAAMQLAQLAHVAMSLGAAQSLADVEAVVRRGAATVLGSSGAGSVVLRNGEGDLQVALSPDLDATVGELFEVIPWDSPLPSAYVARTGRPLLLPNRAAGLAYHPVMEGIYDAIDSQESWAVLPLQVGDETIGSMAMGWSHEHFLTGQELEILEVFSAQCAQAVQRLQAEDGERQVERRFRKFAEAFQNAMLSAPPPLDDLDVEVRYRPAVDVAQVGGDWYDCFPQPDGSAVVIVGDVAGHDVEAAGTMVQMRGVLRALAYDAVGDSPPTTPAAALERFEAAATALSVDEMAAVLVARVGRPHCPWPATTSDRHGSAARWGVGQRTVLWSNAGNPPPIVLSPDGSTRLLDHNGDVMLGVAPELARVDHVAALPEGATLLAYTDGLIERRRSSIDDGIAALRFALNDLGRAPLGQLCDQVLSRLAPLTGEDDIALVAVRGRPVPEGPRPRRGSRPGSDGEPARRPSRI